MNTLWGDEWVETRTCSECREVKALTEFAMDTTYVRSKCKSCKQRHTKQLSFLKRQHSSPPDDYSCPVCGDTVQSQAERGYVRTSWCLDHDHESGEFRGWLCHLCNTGVSNLKEDPDIVMRMYKYLTGTLDV
jgi:hypothetical protein